MSEAKTAVGRRTGITEKSSGWIEFQIDIGGNYPLKLSTKKQEVIDAARAFGDGPGVWHWDETDGKENPHRPGTFYKNRYLVKVEPTGEGSQSSNGSSSSGGKYDMTKEEWADKERRDLRSRSWGHANSALASSGALQGLDAENTFLRLQELQRKIYQDITGVYAYPEDDSDLPF